MLCFNVQALSLRVTSQHLSKMQSFDTELFCHMSDHVHLCVWVHSDWLSAERMVCHHNSCLITKPESLLTTVWSYLNLSVCNTGYVCVTKSSKLLHQPVLDFGPYFIICSKLTWSVSFLTIVVSLMFLWGTLCCFLMSKWNVSENALVQKGRIEQSWSLYTPVEKLFSEWLVSLYSILLLLLLHGNCFLCAPLRDPPPSYPSVLFV